ncbi:cytochrome P450 [Schizopora paradoxa]|uniref:Cytochrome P450 n=1 Tax=Schizopora paradoxa TaxID=27342 RepID=A0A0H2S1A3_9AGAM|nr:cytochrome P450 [Schizopora paradoxa]
MDLQGWDWVTINVPYGDTFRKHTTYQHRFMNSPETLKYCDVQVAETRKMLAKILNSPGEYEQHVKRLPGTVVILNIYGHRVEKDDKYVELGRQAVRYAAESKQYFYLDVIPWLRYFPEWVPFVKFQGVAREARKVAQALRFNLYELTKKRIADGAAEKSMTSIFLAENTQNDGSVLGEPEFCAAAATLFNGGVDTTATAIMAFVLYMLQNPDAQRCAQQEIDQVVGTERLPTFEDEENLPYTRAICEEILRIAVITPLAMPHSSTSDDVYKGYRIPVGTTVLANVWQMSRDEHLFEDPSSFKPERWLPDSKYSNKKSQLRAPRPRDFAFGFGRRICPGQKWAEQLLFIAVASMLAALNIEKAVDENGREIEPNNEYLQSFVRTLGSSKCKITPRSRIIADIISASVENAS